MKQIVKTFNILIKKTIFKVQNKTNNNFKISNFNKFLITFIGLLFLYLFYLSIPLLYDKTWVQTNMESKLLNEFKVNLSTSASISYRILPAPHFLIKDSKILVEDGGIEKSIAEIKDVKLFLSQKNFFDKKRIILKKVIINGANFSLLRADLKLLNNTTNKDFPNKKIIVNNSNIFFKDNLGEAISIIKINSGTLFFDKKKLLNFFKLRGEVFNIPFSIDFKNQNNLIKIKEINFNAESLKLNIFNRFVVDQNNSITGKNIISLLNSRIDTNYKAKEKLITFESNNSRIANSQINYNGVMSINPFDLDLNIYFDDYKISKLFKIHSGLTELIKSQLLFNENISVKTTVVINSNIKDKFFQNAKINFHIINGEINFNNTKFINDKIGSLELINSNLFFKNNKLILNSDILIEIKSSDHLFSLLNTVKTARKKIKKVLINLDYDLLTNQFKFNNVKVDNNAASEHLLRMMDGFSDNDLNNLNKSRRLINEILNVYAG